VATIVVNINSGDEALGQPTKVEMKIEPESGMNILIPKGGRKKPIRSQDFQGIE